MLGRLLAAVVLAAASGVRADCGPVLQLDEGCGALLVHPRVFVYPAHCRDPLQHVSAGSRQLPIERCQSYPDGSLFGTDIGFCVLREPVDDLPIVPPALGCEAEQIREGQDTWFGGMRGVVEDVSDEIAVAGPGFGVCPGDSGGPLLVEVPDGDARALRVAGILSASSEEGCAQATAYFTPLWPFAAWIEAESGFDISPCGEPDGSWRPGPACRSRTLQECEADFASATCGPAAVQNGTPNIDPKGQNRASCQTVLVRHSVHKHSVNSLMCLGLCAAVALRRRKI